MHNTIANFFSPSGVAIIGASSNPEKLSHGILINMVQYGYAGGIYPVNPGSTEIAVRNPKSGEQKILKCYADVSDVPDPVELAVIVLPAKFVLQVVESCGKRGIKNITIISGGFKEVGDNGSMLENELLRIAKTYQIRLTGPNCVGTVDLYSGLNTTFIRGLPNRGPIGFLSQSGAIIGGVLDLISDQGCGFSKIVSMGNEADVTETDLLEYLGEDPLTKVIVLYVEEIKDGRRFIEVARKVNKIKPIILLKAGNSEAGARAISSHTGSLAGSKAAYEAAFEQTGIVLADSVHEVFALAAALAYQPPLFRNHVAVVTNAGGLAALASDSISKHNLKLADFSQETRNYLRQNLNPGAQVDNPIDLLGGGGPEEYKTAIKRMLDEPNVDAIYTLLVPHALINPEEISRSIGETALKSSKPILTCIMGDKSLGNSIAILDSFKIPMFTFPELGGKLFRAMLDYHLWKKQSVDEENHEEINQKPLAMRIPAISNNSRFLGELQTRPLLEAYGIPVVHGAFAQTAQDAADIAQNIGFPVVLKIVSPDILHKSDYGGIRLNIQNREQTITEVENLISTIKAIYPDTKIEGVLVESMAPKGHEIIIGMRRDPNFGPLLMFGMGGIFVELFNDVAFGVAPLNRDSAKRMIMNTRAGQVLQGLRGQKPADIEAVIDIIVKLSQLSLDIPQISEIEINPLLVLDHGAVALDARTILKND